MSTQNKIKDGGPTPPRFKKWTMGLARVGLIHPPFLTANSHNAMQAASEVISKTSGSIPSEKGTR